MLCFEQVECWLSLVFQWMHTKWCDSGKVKFRFWRKMCNYPVLRKQSDRWIELKFYVASPDMLSYLVLKFQVSRSSVRHRNTGQERLYEFCYLLSFDLWTSYLARIVFLKGCSSLFWKSTNSTKILNGLQHSFQVWQGFINKGITTHIS